MIHKYTDDELLEMGVAKYHIRQWHRQQKVDRAIDRSLLQWTVMGVKTNKKELDMLRNKIMDNYDELVTIKSGRFE